MAERLDSDEILASAARSYARVKMGPHIGIKSQELKRSDLKSKAGRTLFAIGAILVGAGIVGSIIDGIGITGVMITGLLGAGAAYMFMRYPRMKMPTMESLRQTDLKTLVGKTELWLEAQRGYLPRQAVEILDGIGTRLDQLAPHIVELPEHEPAANEIRKLVGEHLPEMVGSYRRIPDSLKNKSDHGPTPHQQLIGGLTLIDQEIEAVTKQIVRGELDKLAIRGRYLEMKYDKEAAE
ncbi:hypothetical protein LPB140_10685 [Sphingorhabdus lutea]|uniref:Uncharacterized protein n=1 Tax=Sphingorhabdus lutea TaxID=1913578 RepID=A0A1L3JDE0_9SPHN|nr:hypothetical protein [Sphingorhabdus lutea]APG63177.1 hypothetical protein LPB140_10685 [Sphingorhabdus lutea]